MDDTAIVAASQDKGSEYGRLSNLRTPGLLAQKPLIGVLMVLLGTITFGVIVFNLQTNGPLVQLDLRLANDMHAMALHSPPLIRSVMIFGFYLGEHIIVAIGAFLALYFLYKRFWPELCMVVIAWAGEGGMWLVLSTYFNRPRPMFDVPVWHQMTAPSFPSGHSISAVMCYGFLAYLVAPRMTSRFWKAVIIVAAVLVILFVGYSRLFVGDHYLSDVLAGYALDIAWSGLVYTRVELIAKRKRKRKNRST
jgi:undecaprenyl-diphosphatase